MDTGGSLEKRGRALEDEFFYRVDKQLAEQLRARLLTEQRKAALSRICGLTDEVILDALVAANITNESFVALTLVPLMRVAWADGRIEAAERAAIMQAAAKGHCPEGSVGYALLSSWLDEAPSDRLYEAWQAYTHVLCAQMTEDARNKLRDQVVGGAREVAESAGGILGIHKISSQEEAVLEEIEHVFCLA